MCMLCGQVGLRCDNTPDYVSMFKVHVSCTDLLSPPVGATDMTGGKCRQVHVVVHEMRQVRLREDILHPFLEGEVVDTTSLCGSVRQVPDNNTLINVLQPNIMH